MAKDKFKKKFLEVIKTKQIIPKRWWLMKRWGKRGVLAMTVMAGVMMLFGVYYYLDFYNYWDLWVFGEAGRYFFWETFPYWWLALAALAVLIASRWYREVDDNYQKGELTRLVIIAGLNLIMAAGLVMIKNKWELEIWMWLLKL